MTGITIDANTVAALTNKAILDLISSEERETLIATAITMLTDVPKDRYGHATGAPAIIQQAFNDAVRKAANDVVKEAVESDPRIKEAVASLLPPLVEAIIQGEGTYAQDMVAEAVAKAYAQRAAEKRW